MLTSNGISALVIDTLCRQSPLKNTVILCHYCDYQVQKEQSAVNIIGSLFRQVNWKLPVIQSEIRRVFNESKKRSGKSLQLTDMIQLFVQAISSIRRAYICVDAVDVLLPEDRSELLRALQRIIQEAPNARLFLTTRPHIRPEFVKHFAKEGCVIDLVADQGDIASYVSIKIEYSKHQCPGPVTENLKDDIMKIVPGQALGT